jgi:hypothetical protein
VTRPADNNDAPPLPSAPRSCACGHPVYDDQEPRCPLCACQEHKPRFPAVCDHSAPATVSPDAGEASTGPQPELSRAVPALPTATARCYPETCAPRGTPMSGARCCRSLTEPEPLPEARTDGSAQRLAASRADGSRHPPGNTVPLCCASLAGNRPVWNASASDLSTIQVPATSRSH